MSLNSFRFISCLEVKELRSFYIHIYIFVPLFPKSVLFYFIFILFYFIFAFVPLEYE